MRLKRVVYARQAQQQHCQQCLQFHPMPSLLHEGLLQLQTGNFKATQRAATVLYRGAQFFAVSFVASMAGHSLTKYLVSTGIPFPATLPGQPTMSSCSLQYGHTVCF